MSLDASCETAAHHSSPVAAMPTLASEGSPTVSGSFDGTGVPGFTSEDASMKLLRLEDVFFGGTEEERQEAQLAVDKVNVLRVRAQQRRQEAQRRKSLTETLQKLQAEEIQLDQALSDVEDWRRTNEDQRTKLLIEAEQLFKRRQDLVEKRALVSQTRARLVDEAGGKACWTSSAGTEEVKATSPPDNPASKGHAARAGTCIVPERTVSLQEAVAPDNDHATPRPPLHDARRPQTASGVSLSRARSRIRPGTASSTSGTLTSLWRRSSVTKRAESIVGDASQDTSFGSSIASRMSSLGSAFAPFTRRKELSSSANNAKPTRDILSFYAEQGLDAKKKEKAEQMQATRQGQEAEEDVEEIAADIMEEATDESTAQRRMATAYI